MSMADKQGTEIPVRANRAVAWLRFLLWITPGGLLLFVLLALMYARPPVALAAAGGFLGLTVFCAVFHALLVCHEKCIQYPDRWPTIRVNIWRFIGLQVFAIPGVFVFVLLILYLVALLD
ncbi:hypothetical protein [Luteolibacter sp. Populi]|uniref:hypothetical protein n=1 Tax=Luteolibacter sp. Populi TaxID=3230487 RepID=UPI00346668DA